MSIELSEWDKKYAKEPVDDTGRNYKVECTKLKHKYLDEKVRRGGERRETERIVSLFYSLL